MRDFGRNMKVREVMTRGIMDIDGDATAEEAMRKMHEWRVSSLLSDGGIVTWRDILSKVIAQGKNPQDVRVKEIMSNPVVTVHPDATVEDIAKIISNREIGKFPVADDNGIVGFVSSSDVLRAMVLEGRG